MTVQVEVTEELLETLRFAKHRVGCSFIPEVSRNKHSGVLGDLIMQCEADQEKKPSYKESYLPPRRAATLQSSKCV